LLKRFLRYDFLSHHSLRFKFYLVTLEGSNCYQIDHFVYFSLNFNSAVTSYPIRGAVTRVDGGFRNHPQQMGVATQATPAAGELG
jgi:hypothetical protein